MKGIEIMQSEKQLDNAVLLYLIILFLFVITNIFKSIGVVDLLYLLVVICSILKIFMIIYKRK